MARLGNKKSRKGCMRCKNRKVKCDEVRPACGWCTSHSIQCIYPTQSRQPPSSTPSALSTESADCSVSTGSVARSNSASPDCSQLELGLFHYYVYTVARTFPSVDKERGFELHANIIPQASLRLPNLRNAMYAYALLHMHVQKTTHDVLPRNIEFFEDHGLMVTTTSDSGDQTCFLSLHRTYLDRALQGQRGVVSEIDAKNADGICITAILLAQVELVHASQARLDLGYSVPSGWFRLQSSFTSCLLASRHLLTMDSATSTIIHSLPSIDTGNLDEQIPTIFRHLLEWRPENVIERMDPQVEDIYRKCIVELETVYNRISQREPWQALGRRILAFPNVGLSAFHGLIEDHQPRALVILAHLLAMTKRIDHSWWIFQGVADYHVRGIASLVPDEWHWALRWPMWVLETNAADTCFELLDVMNRATVQ